MRRRWAAALAIAVLAQGACGGVQGGPGRRSSFAGSSSRDERVLLTRFADVTGVGVTQRLVFITTPQGLGVYDRQFDAWLPPLAAGTEYPGDRVSFVAGDPTTDAVWVGGAGFVFYYQPSIDLFARANVPGAVDYIMFDRRNAGGGALVRSAGQWSRVSSTGFVQPVLNAADLPAAPDQIRPPTLAQLYDEFPGLQSFERLLTRDSRLRSWQVSSGAKSPDRASEVWLGTLGNGLYKVNPLFNSAENIPFGLLEPGAGALALAADGVWAAGSGDPGPDRRGGITFIESSLQEWRWLEGGLTQPLAGVRAYDLEVRGEWAWVATERGVARVATRNDEDFVLWAGVHGLPDDRAYAVAARPGGAWVGTARGLVFLADSASRRSPGRGSVGRTLLSGTPVRALLATGDTLWIGTDAGLLLLQPGNDSLPVRAAASEGEPRLLQPVRAIARSDSIVVVANADELLRYDLNTGRLLPRLDAVNVRGVGRVNTVAVDGRTLWVGGALGVIVVDRGTGTSRFLGAADRIAAEAYDIVLARDFAWVATRAGVVRLTRLPDGTVR